MCFKPVYFSFMDCFIDKSHRGSAFPLAPPTFAVRTFQIASNVYPPASGYCFYVFDLAEDLEFHHTLSLLRYPCDYGEPANAPSHRLPPQPRPFRFIPNRLRAALWWNGLLGIVVRTPLLPSPLGHCPSLVSPHRISSGQTKQELPIVLIR